MAETLTQLHVVSSLDQAFAVACDLGAEAIALDLEGVPARYVGNTPTVDQIQGAALSGPLNSVLRHIINRPDIPLGLMTNNENNPPHPGHPGFVDYFAKLELPNVPYVYKGMPWMATTLKGKPKKDEGIALTTIMDVDPGMTVLIDDQLVKNAGAAVSAGFLAIISPPPVGDLNPEGIVIEHSGVMKSREHEARVLASYENRGILGRLVMGYFGTPLGHPVIRH